MRNKMYTAIVADIKSSRSIRQRYAAQTRLQAVLARVNEDYAKQIAANFVITLGDEFQGLLKHAENALRIALQIRAAMSPIQIRVGIGIGTMQTQIQPEQALGADGPAYHLARRAIEEIRKTEAGKESPKTEILLLSNSKKVSAAPFNHILSLLYVLEKSWTPRQQKLVESMLLEGCSQRELAEQYHVTQSSVNQSLRRAHYYHYQHSFDYLSSLLKEV